MGSVEIEAVQVYKGLVDSLLDRAAQVKPDKQIEPPVTEALLGEPIWQVPEQEQGIVKQLNQQTQFAAVEIAFREKFYRILVRSACLRRWHLGSQLIKDRSNRRLPLSANPVSSISGIFLTSYRFSLTTVSRVTVKRDSTTPFLTLSRTMRTRPDLLAHRGAPGQPNNRWMPQGL